MTITKAIGNHCKSHVLEMRKTWLSNFQKLPFILQTRDCHFSICGPVSCEQKRSRWDRMQFPSRGESPPRRAQAVRGRERKRRVGSKWGLLPPPPTHPHIPRVSFLQWEDGAGNTGPLGDTGRGRELQGPFCGGGGLESWRRRPFRVQNDGSRRPERRHGRGGPRP